MFEDLKRIEETLPPPEYTNTSRRPFYIVVAFLVGIFLVTLTCLAVYLLVLRPRSIFRGATQTAQIEIQNAISIALTQASETPTLPSETPQPTASASGTVATLQTETPASSPTATQSPTPSELPTLTPGVTETPGNILSEPGQIILSDGFAGPGSGWVVLSEETFELGYAQGGYRILVNMFNTDTFSVRSYELEELVMEVDAVKASGPDDGFYGVMCHFINSANYYGLVIDNTGGYRIYKKQNGVLTDLGPPGRSPVIRIGEVNRLRADCVGDTLTLSVNQVRLLEVQDNSIEGGIIGLVAGTLDRGGLEVVFDDLLLATP